MPAAKPSPHRASRAKGKALLLAAFIVAAVVLIRYTPVKGYLNPDTLGLLLTGAGWWAPLIYILVYAVGVCLFVPGTLLTGLGAAIFGPYWGFLWSGSGP